MESRQDSLGIVLADVWRLMRRTFQRRLEGSSLTMAQVRALVHISRHQGVHQVELADLLEVQPITLARLIDQLSDCGLVERRPDPADRRAYLIHLTRAAAPHLAAIDKVAASVRADALRDLGKQEADLVLVALRKMRDNLASR